jgi:hypothetical protein
MSGEITVGKVIGEVPISHSYIIDRFHDPWMHGESIRPISLVVEDGAPGRRRPHAATGSP